MSALAALQLVEAGHLSLHQPINHSLKHWQLPENEFTQQVPVTLAHLLSHTAGTTVHGFRGYAQHEVQPSAIQVLNGDDCAASDAVVVDTLPGTAFRYSGGGTTVVQQAMEDVSHQPFAQILHEQVLGPAGMSLSTFEQPLPESQQHNVACGHLAEGQVVPGKWHNYPTQAAASLWCSAGDLAKFSMAVMKAWRGEEGAILSKALCDEYLREHKNEWGLGPRLFVRDGEVIGFHHGGANEGYRCNSLAFLDGRGAVVMTNSDQADPLIVEILAAAAEVYSWPKEVSKTQEWFALSEAEQLSLSGTYRTAIEGEDYELTVKQDGEGLKICIPDINLPNTFCAIAREKGSLKLIDCIGYTASFSEDENERAVVNVLGYFFVKDEE